MVTDVLRREKARITRAIRQTNRKLNAEQGQRLKQWRVDHGMTQRELAQMLGLCQPSVSLWETGSDNINYDLIRRNCPELLEALKEVPSC